MTPDHLSDKPGAEVGRPKGAYRSPVFRVYGDIRTITQASMNTPGNVDSNKKVPDKTF